MGKGRSRRRKQQRRRSRQDVICLPPPQEPPLTEARSSAEDCPAIPLAQAAEELVCEGDSDSSAAQNRQQRRKTRRELARETRRRGAMVATNAPAPPVNPMALTDSGTPLPRERALADPNERVLARLRRWFQTIVTQRRSRSGKLPAELTVEQLVNLRNDVSAVQDRLDKMIAAAAAR